jgi:hypothetical protein
MVTKYVHHLVNRIKLVLLIFLKNRRIDFLIGGTQKGGTTALDYYLRKHPQVGMAKRKEVHFFDNEQLYSRPSVNYNKYHIFFDLFWNKKVYGEVTPIYIYWESCCKRIYEYNPNIKLIFILRNPITRAFSHWNMVYDRNSDIETFSSAIKNEPERLKEALPYQHREYSYIDRGLYSKQIKRYKSYFSENQLMFIKYEEFKANQEKTLIDIFNFIGINPDEFIYEHKIVHKREKHSEMSKEDKEYLIRTFKDDIYKVEKELNWDCSDWLK